MAYQHPKRKAARATPEPKSIVQAWIFAVDASIASTGRFEGSYRAAVAAFAGWKASFGMAFEGVAEDQPAAWAAARGLVSEIWWDRDLLVFYRREFTPADPEAAQPKLL